MYKAHDRNNYFYLVNSENNFDILSHNVNLRILKYLRTNESRYSVKCGVKWLSKHKKYITYATNIITEEQCCC